MNNGQALVNLVTSILGNEAPDPSFILILINLAKTKYERMRPWKVLVKVDNSQVVNGANTYLTPFSLPSDFVRYLGESSLFEGDIMLFDGNDGLCWLNSIPYELTLQYKNSFGRFAPDYRNRQFYIMGLVPQPYTIYQYYIASSPNLTLSTFWTPFDSYDPNYSSMLAFDAAARWRLGTDYDDVAAFNADDNGKMAMALYNAMAEWDNELALSAVNSLDYRNNRYGGSNFGPRGVRASG